jgi:hypothetical protein
MNLLINAKRPIVNHRKSYKLTHSEKGSWIGWFSIDQNSNDLEGVFRNWLEHSQTKREHNDALLKKAITAWEVRMRSFIPSFPCHSIFLSYEKEEVGVFPMPYRVKLEGIFNPTDGWPMLWPEMIYEPPIRIIELTPTHYKLYEIVEELPALKILIQYSSDDKYAVLHEFITSVGVICTSESGPIVVACSNNSKNELKCLMLANYLSVQSFWNLNEVTSVKEWWKKIAKSEVTAVWKDNWTDKILHDAASSGMLINSVESLNNTIKTNRIRYILLPYDKDQREVLYKNTKDIIKNKIRIIHSNMPQLNGIKHNFKSH